MHLSTLRMIKIRFKNQLLYLAIVPLPTSFKINKFRLKTKMAAFMCKTRGIFSQCRRLIHLSTLKNDKKVPDPWDLMTGMELWEAVQHKKGNHDPFMQQLQQRGPGTKDCPNVVYSAYKSRIVGCICGDTPEASRGIMWMYLHEGYPKRCYCGHWFVLERVPIPEDVYEDSS